MEIKELVEKAHENAVKKGFYVDWFALREYNKSHNSRQMLLHSFIAQRIALIHSEISEALEAARVDDIELMDYTLLNGGESVSEDDFMRYYETNHKNGFASELAGAMIRIADLAGWLKIDLQAAVVLEMRYNALRPHKHNKLY